MVVAAGMGVDRVGVATTSGIVVSSVAVSSVSIWQLVRGLVGGALSARCR